MELYTEILELCADCIQFIPLSKEECQRRYGNDSLFLCGNYQLLEDGKKTGKVLLYGMKGDEVEQLSSYNCSAIFDLKWDYTADIPCFAQACSDGTISYSEIQETSKLSTKSTTQIPSNNNTASCLSLSWNTRLSRNSPKLATSLSDGTIHILQKGEDAFEHVSSWKAHEYETWMTTFDPWSPELLYSGADDCLLKGWDLRTPGETFTNNSHTMGVCCIDFDPFEEHKFVTGSYDEKIRLFDSRSVHKPISELELGGGVWRLVYSPHESSKIASACMRNGMKILSIDEGDNISVEECFEGHEGLSYGIDWSHCDSGNILASCSFYNKKLCVWKRNVC